MNLCQLFRHWILVTLIVVSHMGLFSSLAEAQLSATLQNGDMEQVVDGQPIAWSMSSNIDAKLVMDESTPFSAKYAAMIDAVAKEENKSKSSDGFSNLMQSFDATPYQGKRVVFRAAVKAEELGKSSRVQLWCRADSKDEKTGEVRSGAFDNMDGRPIKSSEWAHYEIVLDIQDDATSINLGMFLIGTGRAYLDDATWLETSNDKPTTGKSLATNSTPVYELPPQVLSAFRTAEDEPRQAFWNFWLIAPATAIALFFFGLAPRKTLEVPKVDSATPIHGSWFHSFCFHFSFLYWSIYCIPTLLAYCLPIAGPILVTDMESVNAKVIEWTAKNLFQIDRELVPPNGSGDTTYNYISILIGFTVSFTLAILWTIVQGRSYRFTWRYDALQMCLRYALAFTMMNYGLAKLSLEFGQFPPPQPGQLDKTWGDSSPMNVLWTFMGYSRAYTFFSGIGELVSGVLLLWRRTTSLGALVGIGIMTNVVMLNFSYDVPVKIMSSHLLVMACLIVLPDAIRLSNILLFNRATSAADLSDLGRIDMPGGPKPS